HLLTLSARSETALKQLVSRYERHIAHHPEQRLQDICYTANTGRSHFPHRLAIMARSSKSAQEQLQMFTIREKASGLWSGKTQNRRKPKIAFLFTGQGSQYPGMGKQLYETQPGFRRSLDICDEIIRPSLKQPLQAAIIAAPETSTLLVDMAYVQTTLFALEYALTELWSSWGITPDIVLGHSIGEYAAACIAGAFSLEEGLRLVYERGRLMNELPEKGAMAAVLADTNRILEKLAHFADDIVISAFNGPRHTVIAGPTEVLAHALQELEEQGIATQPLPIGQACHSAFVDPMLDTFEQLASQITYQPLKRPLVSTVTGQICEPGERLEASYWQRQLREPVRFAQGIATLAAYGVQCNLEIGPAPSLLGMGKRCFTSGNMSWLPSLKQKQHDWQVLLSSLGELYVQGASVNWEEFEQGYTRNRIELPTYPFERKRYWLKAASAEQNKSRQTEQIPRMAQFSHTHNGKLQLMSEPISTTSNTQHMQIEQAEGNGVSVSHADTILATLRSLVGRLLQIEAESIDDQAPFLEMGADSLVLIEAVRTIEKSFGVKLSVKLLFEELTTLRALADYIGRNIAETGEVISQKEPQSEIAVPTYAMEQWVPVDTNLSTENIQAHNGHTELPGSDKMIGTETERLMSQQLSLLSQVMSQQLAILQNSTITEKKIEQAGQVRLQQSQHMPSLNGHTTARAQEEKLLVQQMGKKNAARPEQKPYIPYQAIKPGTMGGLTRQQQRHLDALIERYTRRTQQSRRQTEAKRSVLADNRNAAGFRFSIKEMLYPIIAQRSQGAKFWDVDGNEYIDISMGFGVNLFGHNAPFIVEAIETQLKQGIQLGPQAELAGEVAELIHELTGMERVTFCNSGTEAVMTALRLARTGTGRKKIAIFAGSYHGTFDGVLAEGHNLGKEIAVEPMAPGTPAGMIADVLVLDYASPQALEQIQAHAHELAAVLVEPVQSRRPELQPQAFLQQIRRLCDQGGIALIFDEVITGFRIHPGGAQAWFGVKADLATYGKIVGGGMPIGVVAGKASFMNGIDGGVWRYGDMSYPQAETTFFAGTFCKHPLTMAAARAVLNVLKSTGVELQESLNKKTEQLARTLNTYFIEGQVPLRVVYFGSLFRFTFTGNMDLFFYHLLDKGIYIWEGRNCFLSTAHTGENIASIIQAVKESIEEMRAGGFLPTGPANPGNAIVEPTTSEPTINIESKQQQHTVQETVPLTEAQKQLWLLTHVEDNASIAYNETVAVQLEGTLQRGLLHRAIQTVVDRHEALRTTIDKEGEWQYIQSGLQIDLPLIDFSNDAPNEASMHIQQWLKAENQRGFDLVQGPLVRFSLLKQTEQQHIFVFSAHHIIVDGWSMGIVLQEISTYYNAACNNIVFDLAQPMQFREYVRWQDQQQLSEDFSADEAVWLEQFQAPLPVLELPIDHPRPINQSFHGARLSTAFDEQLCNALKQLSRQNGCTFFMTLLAGYTALLHRITGQEDIIVGVPVAGRALEGGESLVGYCVNIVPLRSTIRAEETFLEHLIETKKSWLSSYGRHEYPFSVLINKLRLPRDPSRFPLISSTFNLDRAASAPHMHNLMARLMLPDIQATKFDLSVNSIEQSGELLLQFDYNPDLFDEGSIRRLQGYLHTLFESVVAGIKQPLKKIPILRPEEIQQQFIEWNATWRLYPLDRGVHQLFEVQVRKNPTAIAIEQQGKQISYQELNVRANQIAHYLKKQQKIQPEQCIGIICERSIEQVIAILGILKARGSYLPIDPKYPQERSKFMLQDAQVPLVFSQTHLREQTERLDVAILYLDDDEDQRKLAEQEETNPVNKVEMGQLAYVIYTSGSTGLPKGVEVTHNNLLNLVYWHLQNFSMSSEDSAMLIASPAFDASVWELW
ncbi:MAG TPA: aminotransferase class III-fold pyridoxal phosphate-dependent enzyme, partial [Ktedonobacteraceae bacterium]